MQKRKGTAGEQECARELRAYLVDQVAIELLSKNKIVTEKLKELKDWIDNNIFRNMEQTRTGGYDLDGTQYAIEIKRHKKPRVNEWWLDTCKKAEGTSKHPVLAYRLDRKDWQIMMPLGCLNQDFKTEGYGMTVTMEMKTFTAILREVFAERWLETQNSPESLEDEPPGIR